MPILDSFLISGDNFSKANPNVSGDDFLRHSVAEHQLMGVFDGARSPHPLLQTILGKPSDAFAASYFKQQVIDVLSGVPYINLIEAIQRANTSYGTLWTEVQSNAGVTTILPIKPNAPAAAFAVADIYKGRIFWAQGADCILGKVDANGEITLLADDQFQHIDADLKRRQTYFDAQKALKDGMMPADVLVEENKVIHHNRQVIYNRSGGIAVLNGEPSMLSVMRQGWLPLGDFKKGSKLIALTDGGFQKIHANEEVGLNIALQTMAEKGANGLKELLLGIQTPFPTDATAVMMSF